VTEVAMNMVRVQIRKEHNCCLQEVEYPELQKHM